MSTASHSTRSIHSAFAAIPSSSSLSYASAVSNVLGGRHPPGLSGGYGGITSVTYTYPNTYPPGVRQQPSQYRSSRSSAYRRTPSPPSRRAQLASLTAPTNTISYDPFADPESEPLPHYAPVRIRTSSSSSSSQRSARMSSPSMHTATSSPSSSTTTLSSLAFPRIPEPASSPPLNSDKALQSKLVAGILLNRVHAVGKPMRRMPQAGPKAYIRSRLSASMVAVEC